MPHVERGLPIIGLEPSCLLTLRDEIPGLLPGEETRQIADKAKMLEEYLVEQSDAGALDLPLQAPADRLLLHGHCHQKAMGVASSVEKALRLIPGADVEMVETSCCGMAGAFGYGKETHEVSMKMGELDLFPAIRKEAEDTLVVADGTSCRHQIHDGTGRDALHVARVLEMAIKKV